MSEELHKHRLAMMNIYFLVMCQLLSWLTLMVNVISCGGGDYQVSFREITVIKKYPEDVSVEFRIGIPEFNERYCSGNRETVIERNHVYEVTEAERDMCIIVPHLALAEYVYKMLLMFNFMIVIYLILNIWFTGYGERVPKILNFGSMHYFYPFTYIIGSVLYFIVSEAFTMKGGFEFESGFFIMIGIFILALISAIFNKTKLHAAVSALEHKEPLLEN